MKSKAWTEKFMQGVFLIAACTSVLAVALICIFLFANGVPAIREIGFVKFITGELWRPNNNLFGIFPMIIGSLYVTAGAIVFGSFPYKIWETVITKNTSVRTEPQR